MSGQKPSGGGLPRRAPGLWPDSGTDSPPPMKKPRRSPGAVSSSRKKGSALVARIEIVGSAHFVEQLGNLEISSRFGFRRQLLD